MATSLLIGIFAQRDGAKGWAEVSIDSNTSVAAAKEIILKKLRMTDPIDQATLWQANAAGALDDRLIVDGQLMEGNMVTVKVNSVADGGGEYMEYDKVRRVTNSNACFRFAGDALANYRYWERAAPASGACGSRLPPSLL